MKHLIGLAIAGFMTVLAASTANAQGTWSSIALDMAGGYNLITGADTEDEARQQAVDACGDPSCEAVMATESQCLSVAATPEGNYNYGWAQGGDEESVTIVALGYCMTSGYPGCETLIAQCIVPGATTSDGPGPKTKSKG